MSKLGCMANNQMIRILKFRLHKENGIMVIPIVVAKTLASISAVPNKPRILLFRKLGMTSKVK